MKAFGRKLGGGKRLISLLIVAMLLLGMFPQSAFAVADVTLSYASGAAQDANARYLLFFDGITDQSDIYWNNNAVYIDGEAVSGDGVNYVPIGNQLALCLKYNVIESGVNTVSDFTQSHMLQIKAGTPLGNNGQFTISEDIWLKLDKTAITQYAPVNLSYVSCGAQDFSTRFQLTFSGYSDTTDNCWNNNTVYVDGKAVSDGVHYLPNSDDTINLYLAYDALETGATTAVSLGSHVLEIPAGTVLGNTYVVNEDLTFQITGSTVTQVSKPDVTVTLSNDDVRNQAGGCTGGFYFYVSPADALPSDVTNWSIRYSMTTGGIYLNDTLVSGAQLVKLTGNLYYVAFDGCGITFAADDVVKIVGTVTSGDYTVEYTEAAFQYDGSGNWAGYTAPVGNTFTLSESDPGGWQGNLSRYIIWLDDDISGEKTALGTVQLLVDGETKNVETALIDGRYLLILNSGCGISALGEHTVKITAGQAMGGYTAANDEVFYTHSDGSITADNTVPAPEEKTITLGVQESNPGSWQQDQSRYLVWLTDNLTGTRVDPGTVSVTVDGVEKTAATALVNNQFVLLLNASCGITAKGDHTVIIHKDSYFGEYKVAEDVIFYTTLEGPIVVDTPAPAEKTITLTVQEGNPGGWQQDQSRYLVWLTDDLTGTRVDPGTVSVTVDGEEETAATALVNNQFVLLLNASCGITKMGDHTVIIHKDSYFGEYKVTQELAIYTYADGAVSNQPPAQIPGPSETVTVGDDIRNHQGSCTDHIWFTVSPADGLPHNLEADTCKYGAAEGGGIYFNGELIGGTIVKKLENLYYLNLSSVSPITPGDVVTLDGVFGNADYAVRFEKQSFVYLGDGNWELGDYLRDLREQNMTVQDVSELKMGLSEIKLQTGSQTLIGEAVSSTNIAIRTKINLSKNMTEVKLGFSKIDGMWDIEESGWQISLMPKTGEIKMFHDMSSLQTMAAYPFTDGEYTVEIGSVNVHEYIDDVDQGIYCRKIFVKINGEEVLSYQDTDLSRNLGKKLYVYTSADVEDCKLISLTSTGVTLRELEPVVYDYYNISGFAGITAEGSTTSCLGSIDATSNYAVRLHMNPGTDASELKMAIGKVDPERFWEIQESGWQLWMRPASGQVFLAHSMSTWEVMVGHKFSDSYIVEFGVKDQVVEKNGERVSTYCRVLYVKIDGKEVARWEDTNFDRPLGEYVLLYCAVDSGTEISTLNDTATLPVEFTVNGETAQQPEFVQVSSKVVVGRSSGISVTVKSDPYCKAVLDGVYYNGEKLEPIEAVDGKYTYTLEAPQEGDTLKVELTAKTLTVDEPENVFDLFDLSGQAVLHVPERQTAHLGMMVTKDGQAAANSAIRYSLTIPQSFNHIPLTILGDNPGLWGNHGAMMEITPSQLHFCHTATSSRLASFSSELFAPGSTVCVEFGVVKCYENGVYKYDRWYVKAGATEETMELVGWYDSLERGSYGGHAVCYGVDFGGDYDMYSLKETYSITDASTQENKDLLRTYTQLQYTLPELFFPGRAEAYTDASAAENPVQIKFFTKPGTSLKKLTVDGEDVTASVVIGESGAYCYTVSKLEKDIEFSYEIGQDDTKHSISVEADSDLQVSISQEAVITGGDVTVSVTANVGFVPTLTANGTDITDRLSLNENTGVWSVTLKAIRADTNIVGTSQVKDYEIVLTQPENGNVTLGGDVLNGKLPIGGRLELILTPDDGCYNQSVTVNGKAVTVDSDGKAVLEAVYMDAESLDIQAVFVKPESVQQNADSATDLILWIGIGAVAVIVLAAVLLLGRKKKGKEG